VIGDWFRVVGEALVHIIQQDKGQLLHFLIISKALNSTPPLLGKSELNPNVPNTRNKSINQNNGT
jgi:hypothetical protein